MTPASHSAAQKEAEKKNKWAEYMKEAEYDSRAAEGWTKGADGLLVFVCTNFSRCSGWKTGLFFSATVFFFLNLVYKGPAYDVKGHQSPRIQVITRSSFRR